MARFQTGLSFDDLLRAGLDVVLQGKNLSNAEVEPTPSRPSADDLLSTKD